MDTLKITNQLLQAFKAFLSEMSAVKHAHLEQVSTLVNEIETAKQKELRARIKL